MSIVGWLRSGLTVALLCVLAGWCGAVRAQQAPNSESDAEKTYEDLKSKLDKLENLEVEYELHNHARGSEPDKILLRIKDFRRIRLDARSGTYIVNNGNLLYYAGQVGQTTNMDKIRDECRQALQPFFQAAGDKVQAVFEKDADTVLGELVSEGTYPSISMRVTRDEEYTPENPKFSFQLSAGLAANESGYSWLRDMLVICQSKSPIVHENYIKAANSQVEFWIFKETGLLYLQRLISPVNSSTEATLKCLSVTKKEDMDEKLFDLQPPEGVEIKDVARVNKNMMYMELTGNFIELLAKRMKEAGWDPKLNPQIGDVARGLLQKWLEAVFDMHFSKEDRQKLIEENCVRFSEMLDKIYLEESEKYLADTRAYKERTRALMQLETVKAIWQDDLRSLVAMQIRSGVRVLPKEQANELRTLYTKALDAAFEQVFETECLKPMRERIRAIEEEKSKNPPQKKDEEKAE